jgi:hypothetical protein
MRWTYNVDALGKHTCNVVGLQDRCCLREMLFQLFYEHNEIVLLLAWHVNFARNSTCEYRQVMAKMPLTS